MLVLLDIVAILAVILIVGFAAAYVVGRRSRKRRRPMTVDDILDATQTVKMAREKFERDRQGYGRPQGRSSRSTTRKRDEPSAWTPDAAPYYDPGPSSHSSSWFGGGESGGGGASSSWSDSGGSSDAGGGGSD